MEDRISISNRNETYIRGNIYIYIWYTYIYIYHIYIYIYIYVCMYIIFILSCIYVILILLLLSQLLENHNTKDKFNSSVMIRA